MEKVLRESNDGVLVYVAPTKALVNQIAAEIYGRFSKTYPGNGTWLPFTILSSGPHSPSFILETLLAVQTRDTRTGDIQRAQILVTVPEMLGILILSPTLAGNWTSRIRRYACSRLALLYPWTDETL
jgi:superfamily II RNA helicase